MSHVLPSRFFTTSATWEVPTVHSTTIYIDGNTARTLFDINHSKSLFDPPPRVMEIKINKWDLIKLQGFCTAKEKINKMKRQPSEWEKIVANEATDKRSVSKIYKQLIQFDTRKTTTTKNFSREDIQMANKHMKRCLTLLIIIEMQIKTTMRNHVNKSKWSLSKIYK